MPHSSSQTRCGMAIGSLKNTVIRDRRRSSVDSIRTECNGGGWSAASMAAGSADGYRSVISSRYASTCARYPTE